MKMGKLGDVFKKFGVIKDYFSLVVPVLICVVSGLIFIPVMLLSSNLKSTVEKESVQARASRIKAIINNAVSSDQYKAEKAYQDKFKEDANRITVLSKQSSQRELLSYKIFPEPNDKSPLLLFKDFGQKFRSRIDENLKNLRAGDCPSQIEIKNVLAKMTTKSSSASGFEKDITKALIEEKASGISIYAHPYDFPGYQLWDNYNNPDTETAVKESWYSQTAYWIYEDIFQTIQKINAGSVSVLSSPVKRILFISFSGGSGKKGATVLTDDSLPDYVMSPEESLCASYTGRVSSKEMDIVNFQIAVVLDSRETVSFMKELCSSKEHKFYGYKGTEPQQTFKHNQITILACKTGLLDAGSKDHEYYKYGNGETVRLDLICEYMFDSSGYAEIKPPQVNRFKEVEKSTKKTKESGKKK